MSVLYPHFEGPSDKICFEVQQVGRTKQGNMTEAYLALRNVGIGIFSDKFEGPLKGV